ncbi:MAG: ABC transporter ATP-binding protein [Clostridia bacterium]
MIVVNKLTKKFENFTALNKLSCTIPGGCIYGLVGSNGAGKSTLLRLITGIYKADSGEVTIDGESVFDNPIAKSRFVFVSDDSYFLPHSNMLSMRDIYRSVYKRFSCERFDTLTKAFALNPTQNLNTFSKGMRRQAATILALSCMTEYIFFDETFDGLDPVMRNLVKRALYNDVCERSVTAVITSHSLRELEDTCDQLALLHKGGVIFESDVQDLKTALFKVQVAFDETFNKEKFDGIDILNFSRLGSVATLIVRGDRIETEKKIRAMKPTLFEILPLSLEEVFVYEMDALGYEFNDVLV